MDSPDYSSDNFDSSEEEIHGVKPMGRSMTLRDRQRRTYIEFGGSEGHGSDDAEEEEEAPRKNVEIAQNYNNTDQVEEQPFNDDPSGTNQEENFEEMVAGVFNPEIDQILWRRDKFEDDTRKTEYLIKFKEYSYLHCEWMEENQILGIGKNAKNKLNRFNKTFDKKIQDYEEYEMATQEEKFFDPSFVDVDRIIYSTELFPVIHPKKANELKGKWSESLSQVVSILLNFTKNNIHYGVYFMEPVDPDRDGVPNYRKVITNPMDLGTCLNRIYLDYYKNSQQFWNDLGLVFKNCRKFNKDGGSDIRMLCDTLREVSIQLYQQWHAITSEKYEKIKIEFSEKQKGQVNQPMQAVDEKDDLKRQNELEFRSKENEIQNILSQFEAFQSKTFMTQNSNPQQVQFQLNQFINSNPYMFPSKISMDEVSKTIENKASLQELNKLKNPSSIIPIMPKQPSNPPTPADNIQIKQEMNSIITTKFEQNISIQEVELWNPGEYSYSWLIDDKATIPVESEEMQYITAEDMQEVGLAYEVDKLYFVKWKNLSYLDATWERESVLEAPNKINDFRFFNRALDKESRQMMINQVNRHKTYMEILNNPKKKAKCSNAFINDLKNKLYFYDIAYQREPIQYTFKNQPIFKDQKLLRDYQLESLNWLIQSWYSRRNVILADEMGLGKTVQSIAFLNHLNNFEGCRGPFLVLAPLSTLEHWKRTGEDWTNLNSILYYDTNSIEGRSACRGYEWFYIDVSTKGSLLQTAELYKFQILITSYEVFLQDLNQVFLQIPFQFIVVDEAHRLKNTNAKILNSLKRLACKRILLLTGTPIQNNTEELWSLLNYIEPEKFYSLQLFMAEFGDLSKAEQVEKLHKILKPYLLRRRKEEVEQSIPPLQETIIDIEMTTIQKTIYRALYERNKSTLSKGMTNFATSLNNLEMQLRKCCNHPFLIKEIEAELVKDCPSYDDKFKKFVESSGKMILLDKLLPKMKGEGKKVLIFSQFTQMLALLEDYLRTRNYRYEKIDGAVKSKERQNAIDRFNDPSKKRDVFLLSTKAGGLGINLTSANVVIIYDSDWNPQNDVQATARAHRIGQQSEVMVYRLITSKTYESEMFERASKKLGLDQAIFMGGVFQSTKDNGESKNRDKMNKQEVEALLKRGILGLLSDDNKESQTFMEQDIDEILSKNTRLAKCDILSGTYSFQKSTFVSEKTDKNLNVDDPNFWNIVLKNTDSAAKQLLGELDTNKEINRNYDEQKKYMLKLSDSVYKVIENKLNVAGYNADDEKHVMDILNRISASKQFHKNYRDFALQWSYDIARPSRRVKKVAASELEISKPSGMNKSDAPRTRNTRKGDATGSDEEQIFNDEGEEQLGEEEFHNFDEEDDDESLANKKMSTKMKDELLRKLCQYCERSKCTLFCRGFCKRNFHEICKDKLEQGATAGLDKNSINFEIPELKMDEEKLKKSMNLDFLCTDCQKNLAICFKCKKKGKFYPELSSSKSKSKAKPVEKDESMVSENGDDKTEAESTASVKQETGGKSNDLIKCSTANCNKFYHLACISDNPLFKFFDANKHKKFRCALHYCAKCKISGDTMAIAQCFRCPKAYHLKCYAKDKILKITKKIIVCQDHEFEVKNPAKDKDKEKETSGSEKKKNKDKNGTQLKIEKGSDNSMVIKMSKVDDKNDKDSVKEEEDFDDFKIPKNKAKKKLEKEKKKEEPEKKSDRCIYLSFKIGDEVVISDLPATISGKLKRKLEMGEYIKPKRSNTDKEKLTYADLKIDAPEDFDYENYDRDWCRYCGARYSSNFTKGPWGSRTLCTIHYIDWNQKKTLNLSSYKDLPKRPIKPEANTELSYLQKMQSKNDKEFTPELLESLKPSKKIKKAETTEMVEEPIKTEARSPGEIDPQEGMDEEKE